MSNEQVKDQQQSIIHTHVMCSRYAYEYELDRYLESVEEFFFLSFHQLKRLTDVIHKFVYLYYVVYCLLEYIQK